MKVMMLVKATTQTEAGQAPTAAALVAMHKFHEELQKAGVLLDLGGLTPTRRGARVLYRGSERTVLDGPFSDSNELIAAYSLIQVKTLADAIEWAKRAPFGLATLDGHAPQVELRPLFSPSDFAPAVRP